MQQAISKLNVEMQEKNNQYVSLIGGMLINKMESGADLAELIMAEGKTITGSLEAMKNEAKKKQSGGMAMLTDEEGFKIVLKYYGYDDGQAISNVHSAAVSKSQVINIDLDSLL